MKEFVDNELILNRLKKHLELNSDAELANFLGIKPSTVSSWRKRNSVDHELIYAKCNEIDANWLLSGKGEMLKPTIDPIKSKDWFAFNSNKKEYKLIQVVNKVDQLENFTKGLLSVIEGIKNDLKYEPEQ